MIKGNVTIRYTFPPLTVVVLVEGYASFDRSGGLEGRRRDRRKQRGRNLTALGNRRLGEVRAGRVFNRSRRRSGAHGEVF